MNSSSRPQSDHFEPRGSLPAYGQPGVSPEDVAAALGPVLAASARLAEPHSTVTARDAMARVWEALHHAHAALAELDKAAARERIAA